MVLALHMGRRMMRSLSLLFLLVGCVDQAAGEPTAPNQLQSDDKADGGMPLWAGLTSVTLERYAQDPCDNGQHALGDAPIGYDEWVRERAGVRNVCFEVWSPGITDVDNPDYWKLLDVQAHYRFGTGAWKMQYVPSIDQRGHNRRYAWSIDWSLDPMSFAQSLVAVGAPLTIEAESNGYAMISKDLQVYFTVNGRALKSPSGNAFIVRYEGQVREPTLAPNSAGYVLHPSVTCDGLVLGSGAGFFAVDIHDAAAIATLGAGLDGSRIYGTPIARTSANLMSGTFSSETTDPGETLPAFRDAGGTRVVPHGGTMAVEMDTYVRATNTVQTLAATFTNCTLTQ